MSFALSAGVSGVQAHQKMLDVAGNNLANINTVGFKASRIRFSELLSETIRKASAPTSTAGGINPQQMGSGVGVASISPDMSQGNISNTGNPLDLALIGKGYFVVKNGSQSLYTRAGAFDIDANNNLIDPATGYNVQRIGTNGESDGFQIPGNSNINVPYDVAIPAKATALLEIVGNLDADGVNPDGVQTNVMRSNIAFTTSTGTNAVAGTELDELSQFAANGGTASGTITFSGYDSSGTAFTETGSSWVDLTMSISETTTLQDVLTYLNTDDGIPVRDEVQTLSSTATSGQFTLTFGTTTAALNWNATQAEIKTALENLAGITGVTVGGAATLDAGDITITFSGAQTSAQDVALLTINDVSLAPAASVSAAETTKGRDAVRGVLGSDATAILANGRIVITDSTSGYSLADFNMDYTAGGTETLTMPGYFEITTVGGAEVKDANMIVYDTQGGSHLLTVAFVRTDTANTWDMVLTSINGTIEELTYDNRRISGIQFTGTGTYTGLSSGSEASAFALKFGHDPTSTQTIAVSLGTIGGMNGLTQFAKPSTAVINGQDGYESGSLVTISVSNNGDLIGSFSNSLKKTLATLQIATFKNAAGLESVGNGYFAPSVNSGNPVATQAAIGAAGEILGGALEKSNAEVAEMFVQMIEAQNGYQANARTIRIANEMLRELTNLIR